MDKIVAIDCCGKLIKLNEVELLQSQAQAERVLSGIEWFKNQELRIQNQE